MTTIDVDDHPSAEVDLYSPEVVADPFTTLDGLRRRAAAVHVPLHDF